MKYFKVNLSHLIFQSLRGGIIQFAGLDQISGQVSKKLVSLDQVFLTGELADGKI